MSVSPAQENSLDAWSGELLLGLVAIEHLEEALRLVKKMGGATEACRDIDDALFSVSNVAGKAALRVGKLRREQDVR